MVSPIIKQDNNMKGTNIAYKIIVLLTVIEGILNCTYEMV